MELITERAPQIYIAKLEKGGMDIRRYSVNMPLALAEIKVKQYRLDLPADTFKVVAVLDI